MPQRNGGDFRHIFFNVASCRRWVFLHESLQYLQGILGDHCRISRTLFPGRNGAWRQGLRLHEESLNRRPMAAQAFGDNRHRHPLLSPGHYSSFVLQRQLPDTFCQLLVRHFPKVTETNFFVRLWVCSERTAIADCPIFTLPL